VIMFTVITTGSSKPQTRPTKFSASTTIQITIRSAAGQAIDAGALPAGLSGKRPAVAAIVPASNVNNVLSAWRRFSCRVIQTSFNFQKARVSGVPG